MFGQIDMASIIGDRRTSPTTTTFESEASARASVSAGKVVAMSGCAANTATP